MSDAETPQFRVSNEGEPIPPVDPEDLKRWWSIKPGDKEALIAASREANSAAVSKRCWMIKSLTTFNDGQLLSPWQHGAELHDAVFRVAGSFPIRSLRQATYKVPGDSMWGFDPNGFVEKLIEETGISHTWKPVPVRIPEGSSIWTYSKIRETFKIQGPRDPAAAPLEREAKQGARELLWAVWRKCQPNLSRASGNHELHVASVAWHFADFAIDNIDLAREFLDHMHHGEGRTALAVVLDLERRATWLDLECSVCQRLMHQHSDEQRARCQQAVPPGATLYRFRTS